MKPEWVAVALVALGMASRMLLDLDRWVHGRTNTESALERDVRDLRREIERRQLFECVDLMKVQLAKMEEHLSATDGRVEALRVNVEAVRTFLVKGRHD